MDSNFSVLAFALERGERPRVQIRGSSMLPTLRDGMVAEIEPLPKHLRPGEVLVYDIGGMLVAHRYIGKLSEQRFLLCGDANPKTVEHVSRKHILGRVTRVWNDDTPGAPRASTVRLRVLGTVMLHSRALRATGIRSRELVRYVTKRRQSTSFAMMIDALFALMNERWEQGVAILNKFEAGEFFEIASRHGLGGILFRLCERSAAAGHALRNELFEGVRSGRWASAMRADEIIARTVDVQQALARAEIEPIFLKGAARLLRADFDADIHFSNDVDLIVAGHVADAAVEALRADGYDHHVPEHEKVLYRRWRQHRAPLWNGNASVPIEVHTRLCIPGSVTQDYDFQRLLALSEVVDSPIGRVRVLNRVGSALHLAYHSREGRILRDFYLLAQLLRDMDEEETKQFERLIRLERRDEIRITSAVALALRFAGKPATITPTQRRCLSWLIFREDLPLMFKKRGHIIEGIVARCLPPYQGVGNISKHAYTWVYNVIATPMLLSWYRRYNKTCAAPLIRRLFE